MAKEGTIAKKSFTVLGYIDVIDFKHRFIPHSPKYLSACLRKIPPKKELACTFSEKIPTRSEAQLDYHWVLMKYMAEHTGYTKEEVHDAVMRLKFGTKIINFAGHKIEVRKSISNKARLSKAEVVELINYDLELCQKFEIKVPTAEELGYIRGA